MLVIGLFSAMYTFLTAVQRKWTKVVAMASDVDRTHFVRQQ